MIRFKNLTVKNFMSVGNATQGIDFDRNDLTLVLGENLDLGGDGSRNGTGKTTIINALSYALYGNALSNIRKDNLVNKTNGKNMLVSLEFFVNSKEYKIERGRKPNILKFYVNHEEQAATDEAQGENRETQEAIERILGMSHDMFKHVLALNTYTEPFLSLKANDQRTIIEQLLGITLLSERADRIKELNKTTKDGIAQEEFRVRAVQEANKRIEEQIESLRRRQILWQKKYDSDVAYLVGQYNDLTKIDIEIELLAHKDLALWATRKQQQDTYTALVGRQTAWKQKQDKDIGELELTYNKLSHIDIAAELQAHIDLAAYNQRAKDIADIDKLIARCVADEAKEQKVIAKLKSEIEELKNHKCYACGQDFHDTNHETVLSTKEKALQEAALQALAINGQWMESTDALAVLGKLGIKPTTHYKIETEAIRHSSELENIQHKIDARRAETNPYAEQLNELDEVVVPPQPVTHYDTEAQAVEHRSRVNNLLEQIAKKGEEKDPYTEQIDDMQKQALQVVSYDTINDLTRLQEHQEFLLKLLTNKDSFVRKKIIEQNLSYLNQRLTHYLDRIGLPHTVKFQNDLTVSIEELGRELDFDNLSRGERNRLILSMSWAFRDVWESLYHPINLLFIDELIDNGLDTSGVENALALLKKMSRERHKSIWLVSHRDELAGRVENILKVVKENGFTSYNTDVEIGG
jgi:DNA repair exonuclease SbcCD ATPase subunit